MCAISLPEMAKPALVKDPKLRPHSSLVRGTLVVVCLLALLPSLCAQTSAEPPGVLYQQLQTVAASDKCVQLENTVLKRDRVTLTFTHGIVYFSPAVAGKIRAGVFMGEGHLEAPPPAVDFERDNVRRMLKGDQVSADFKTAVLRFTDDTAEELLKGGFRQAQCGSEQASRLAGELEPRLLKETGMNVSARQLQSILNGENRGFFLAQLNGGKLGRFTYLFDPQVRIPADDFGINAGEKGLIFAYDETLYGNDLWMAFLSEQDYASGIAPYSDMYNLVDTKRYALTLDLLEPKKVLGLNAKMDLVCRDSGVRVIPFTLGESLGVDYDERRKKQLHIQGAHLGDGTELPFFQEPWEGGFSVVLPKAASAGEHLTLVLDLKGDFMMESERVAGTYFPRSTETWYPRHGYLSRAQFDVSMIHHKNDHVVSIGEVASEGPADAGNNTVVTEFRMEEPIGFTSFAVGPYEIHRDSATVDGHRLPIEFYSMPGSRAAIKEDFILAEMNNSVRFFSQMFGNYPYPVFRGVYHPFNFGQGFPTTIMIPNTDRADFRTYAFIAHETSHQWWGDVVQWRSYRDQWLSEGFAEYSGMLYAQLRDKAASEKELIEQARRELKMPPSTLTGIGHGRLVDVGPLVMGHRVEGRETRGAYQALVYEKGALVLRMLHFLFTDTQTGDGTPFFDMMRDFVERYKGKSASTEQFFAVVNEHVQNTPLAKKYGYKDLNWFYRQWVMQAYLPSYELSYHLEPDAGGGVILKGELSQSGLPDNENWFTVLPLVVHTSGGGIARGSVAVLGPHSPVSIKLPHAPEKVGLDPDLWVLSDRTSISKQ
jgi:hypothetical protein